MTAASIVLLFGIHLCLFVISDKLDSILNILERIKNDNQRKD